MKLPIRPLGVVAVAAVAVSSFVSPMARAGRPHAGYQGTITLFAGDFTPPAVANPVPGQASVPRLAMQQLAQSWEKAHPGVQIKFIDIRVPHQDNNVILRTRLVGGTAPDIFSFGVDGSAAGVENQYFVANLILDLTPYLEKPSPYNTGSATWNDSFVSPWQTAGRLPSGKYATVPYTGIGTGIFYNPTITTKLGLRMPPRTWAEFIADQQKIKASGYFAMSTNVCCGLQGSWPWNTIGGQLMRPTAAKYGALSYQPNYLPGVMTTEDWVRAETKYGWHPSKDAGFVATARLIKDWSPYFNTGWASANGGNPLQLFANNRLAFYWDASFGIPSIRAQKLSFTLGSFWLPPITRESTPQAPNPPITPPGLGGIIGGFAVPAADAGSPKLPLIIDFLQYITSPQGNGKVVSEAPVAYTPAVNGAKGDPAVDALFTGEASLKRTNGNNPALFGDLAFVQADRTKWFSYTVLCLQGNTLEGDYLAQMDGLVAHSATILLGQNDKTKAKGGTWDLTKW